MEIYQVPIHLLPVVLHSVKEEQEGGEPRRAGAEFCFNPRPSPPHSRRFANNAEKFSRHFPQFITVIYCFTWFFLRLCCGELSIFFFFFFRERARFAVLTLLYHCGGRNNRTKNNNI